MYYFACECLPAYMYYTTCIPVTLRCQKGVSDTLELELQKVVSHQVGAASLIQVLWAFTFY